MSTFMFLLVVGLAAYFLPTLLAMIRGKRNALAIFALNLFLGWTLVGWVVSLVWALTVDRTLVEISSQTQPAFSSEKQFLQ